MHESWHLHALKRARGCGGRFQSKKNDEYGDKSQATVNIDSNKIEVTSSEDASWIEKFVGPDTGRTV